MHPAPATPHVPVHLRMPPSMQMDDAQFYAFCRKNPDYRIERDARGEIEIMPPTGAETGRRNADLVTEPALTHDLLGVAPARHSEQAKKILSQMGLDKTQARRDNRA